MSRYDYRGMRSVLGAACVGLFFVWDLSVNHATYTHGIADVVAPHGVDATDHAAFDEQYGQIPAVNLPLFDLTAQRLQKRNLFGGARLVHRNSSRGSILTVSYSRAR